MKRVYYTKAVYDALCRRALAHSDTPLRRVAVDVTRRPRINWHRVVAWVCAAALAWFVVKGVVLPMMARVQP